MWWWALLAASACGCGRIGFAVQAEVDTGSGTDTGAGDDALTLGPELLTNGDFEAGLTGWQRTTVTRGTAGPPYPEMYSLGPSAIAGGEVFVIDAPLMSDGYLEQSVAVPLGARLRLAFLTWGGSDPTTTTVSCIGTSEVIVAQYDPPCKEDRGCTTPERRTYDIANCEGPSVTLRLRGTATLGNLTRAYFDDVSLRTY